MRKPIEEELRKNYSEVYGETNALHYSRGRKSQEAKISELKTCNELIKDNLLDNVGKISQLEKKLKEAVELLLESQKKDKSSSAAYLHTVHVINFLKSIEQEESDD
jgi:hypothetical protein